MLLSSVCRAAIVASRAFDFSLASEKAVNIEKVQDCFLSNSISVCIYLFLTPDSLKAPKFIAKINA